MVTQHVAVMSEFTCVSSNAYKSDKESIIIVVNNKYYYCISLCGTMTVLPDDVIVMTRGNGRIDGDT